MLASADYRTENPTCLFVLSFLTPKTPRATRNRKQQEGGGRQGRVEVAEWGKVGVGTVPVPTLNLV